MNVDGGCENSEHGLDLLFATDLECFADGPAAVGERDPMHGVEIELHRGLVFTVRALGQEPVSVDQSRQDATKTKKERENPTSEFDVAFANRHPRLWSAETRRRFLFLRAGYSAASRPMDDDVDGAQRKR